MEDEIQNAVDTTKEFVESNQDALMYIKEGTGDFFTNFSEALGIVSAKIAEVAPEVAQAGLNLIQIKGFFVIFISSIVVTLTVIGIRKTVQTVGVMGNLKTSQEGTLREERKYAWGLTIKAWVLGFISIVGTLTSFIVFIPELLSFYNWVSLAYPEGAVALMALEAMGINI